MVFYIIMGGMSLDSLQELVKKASEIIKRLICLKPLPERPSNDEFISVRSTLRYDRIAIQQIEEDINNWQQTVKLLLATCVGHDSEQYKLFDSTCVENRCYKDAKVDLKNEIEAGRSAIEKACFNNVIKIENNPIVKAPKVFISHKSEDVDYANALVTLLNFVLGSDGDKVFCSSVPGYGIGLSRNIMNELKSQFDDHNIYFIVIHSPRYYKSAICLNEMGAAWVSGSQFASFLTNDCGYEDLKGVIDNDYKCVNFKDDDQTLNAHINDFKNNILKFFSLEQLNENKWENARSRFVKEWREK